MKTRIYRVDINTQSSDEVRLVRALNQTQARQHVIRDTIRVELCSQDELVGLILAGTKVEIAIGKDATATSSGEDSPA